MSLLKILAYEFVFSGYVKYCSPQRLPMVVPLPQCSVPAGDQQDCTNRRCKHSDCFCSHLILCLPVTCRTVKMKSGSPVAAFFFLLFFFLMVFLLDPLRGFSEMHYLFLFLITQHLCRLINSCWIFSMPKKITAVMGRVEFLQNKWDIM